MRSPSSRKAIIAFGTVALGCLGPLTESGCGGSTATSVTVDAGSDVTTSSSGGSTKMGGSSSKSSSPPASSRSSSTGVPPFDGGFDAGFDATVDATADAGQDAPITLDSASDSPKTDATGDSSAKPDAAGDAAKDAGEDTGTPPPACTGTETKCMTGTTAGLCVAGGCEPCNSPADNANCTTAYGSAMAPFVCDPAGSCIAGNCNVDTDCAGASAGWLCTANTCARCTSDAECQNDPGYGTGTLCQTSTGACVSSACTSAAPTCGNAADFCCAAGANADCAATGTCSCIPGNCCTNADCPATSPVCGAGGANVCGKCTKDSQCPAGDVCITAAGATQGTCEATMGTLCSGTPTGGAAGGGAPGACTANASDMCCNSTGTPPVLEVCIPSAAAPALPCCPGTAGNVYCVTKLTMGAVCDPNALVCTACGPVTGSTYIVDPNMGSDTTGNGSAESNTMTAEEGCALKTITRALQIIGTPIVPTTIEIVGGGLGPSTATGEVFPLVIPANVTLTTKANSGAVTITVPSTKGGGAGITLGNGSSGVQGSAGAPLTITTTNAAENDGILVNGLAGSTGPTVIANVTLTGFANSGIEVTAGVATVQGGVVSNKNAHGIQVTGGEAIITVPAGGATTAFNANSAHGILVTGTGHVDVTGSVTSAVMGTGTITTNENQAAGVWIEQATGGAMTPPLNTLTNLVSFGNTNGNGMRIVAGSAVTVRGSAFLGNAGDGIIISAAGGVNTITGIDLGDTTTNGGNTLQQTGASANKAAGLCLNVANGQPALLALGNIFQAENCANTAGTLLVNLKSCSNNKGQCPGGVCDVGFVNPGGTTNSTNTANTAKCM